MRRAAGLTLMIGAALIQATWAPRLEVGGAFPNLVLVGVVAVAWTSGTRAALVWSIVGGVLLDLTASGAVGPHALSLLPGVYVIGYWIRNLEHPNALHVALSAAACTVLYSIGLLVTGELLGTSLPAPDVVGRLTLAAAAYNAVLMPIAYEVVRKAQALVKAAPQPA